MHLSTLGILAFFAAGDPVPAAPAGDVTSGILAMLPMVVAMVAFYYFLIVIPSNKDKKQRQDMLSNVKKNDRVITTSGIYGVVTNVQKEQNEITIRVDETTNAKLRITLSAVARILGSESADGTDSVSGKTSIK